MKKFLNFSKLIIIMAIIMINLIEYLFVNVSFADYPTGVYPHDTEPNPTMDEIDKKQGFKLTYFGGAATCSGFSVSDFTQNPKYGWYEFNYNGVNYVVTAIASYAYFKYYTDASWKDYIHYSHTGPDTQSKSSTEFETFQFQFKENGDTELYNAIILDYCGASMKVGENDPQIIDIYMGSSDSYNEQGETFNQQKVSVSTTGVFSSSAGKTNSQNKKDMIIEFFAGIFHGIGDGIQMALNYAGTNMKWKDAKKITYSKGDIEANKNLNKKIQVEDAKSDTSNKTEEKDYKIIKEANISSTADNKQGKKETIYTSSTEIPVMPIDFYSSSIGKVKLFDIDFYNTKSSNSNKLWKGIRQFVSSASHIAMYIAAALLLTMLIWRSILFVRSALGDNPQGAFESRQIMDNFIKAVLIIRMCVFCNDNNDVFV